jgi:uncharacterized protein (DUF1501 family)
MKRRDFLRTSVGAGIALSALPALGPAGMQALTFSPALQAMQKIAGDSDKVFVVIQLTGGNDGLNTLIPVENELYYKARKYDGVDIAIPKGSALSLSSTLGWHPAMSGMKTLYDEGKLAIVQGVMYPNPNRSHFRSTDIWLTATDADVFESTGWIGRYLQTQYPTYPDVLPADPMAVQIGANVSLGFQSEKGNLAVTFRTPEEFYALVGQGTTPLWPDAPDTPAGDELEFIRIIAEASQLYSARVKEAADAGNNIAAYPDTNLAASLKVVANLISGGLSTKFYLVSIPGNAFDTHNAQGGVTGAHAALLEEVSGAIKAFMDDLEALGHADRVAGMTFSEFGRRVEANGSNGTDHGTAAPLFVFGKNVIGNRIHGNDPDLQNLDERGDLLVQYDYREIYASTLAQWFNTPQNEIQKLLYGGFTTLPLFKMASSSVGDDTNASAPVLMQNYPNPASASTVIEYALPSTTYVTLSILDIRGNVITRLVSGEQQAGKHTLPFSTAGLAAGTYFYKLEAGRFSTVKQMQVIR